MPQGHLLNIKKFTEKKSTHPYMHRLIETQNSQYVKSETGKKIRELIPKLFLCSHQVSEEKNNCGIIVAELLLIFFSFKDVLALPAEFEFVAN